MFPNIDRFPGMHCILHVHYHFMSRYYRIVDVACPVFVIHGVR